MAAVDPSDPAAPGPGPGLTSTEAAARQARWGPNLITHQERQGLWQTVGAVLGEPMFLLLVGAAGLYLLLGDLGEGLLLAAFAALSVGLVIWQSRRSARALDALRELAAPQVRVWRDGRRCVIAARDLVPGDLIALGEGERVAADAVLRAARGLSVDESLLTGESAPVIKRPRPQASDASGSEACAQAADANAAWSVRAGTLIVAGEGVAEVSAIGGSTTMGQIGASLASIDVAPTPLELQLRRLVRWLALGATLVSSLLVLWYGLWAADWMQGLLAGIALAMALLPEEFPMALAVFLALGAWRLARMKVLARRPAVVEALGAISVLCVDKTGTLTENQMQLRCLVALDASGQVLAHVKWHAGGPEPGRQLLSEPAHRLLEFAMLASQRGGVEPMDAALLARGDDTLAGTEHLHPRWRLAQAYPLVPELLAVTQDWAADDGLHHVAAKGAPEAIADLCHLGPDALAALRTQAQALAARGLRVLAVAQGRGLAAPPAQSHDYDFTLLGLVAFEDPLRPSVPSAVAQAHRAGIAVVMITGDHPATALAIAAQAGIDTAAGVLTGAQLQAMDDAALALAVGRVRVFARVTPNDKLRLVRAYHAGGAVVAMTGDGVNDAPALKAAHVGIAMGVRGTDVAREAAAVVLLDEDFSRIVDGIRGGRRIDDNLRKVMTYIVAIHVPIAGLALLPLLLGLPPLLLPVHVVVTEMIIDPVCALAFEKAPGARHLMDRPPRSPSLPLVDRVLVLRAAWQGAGLLAATLAAYAVALAHGFTPEEARAVAFVGLTAGNLSLVALNAGAGLPAVSLVSRDFAAFWMVAALALGLLALALGAAPVRDLLHLAMPPLGALALMVAAIAGVTALAWAARPRLG
jgi:Ca2+-transporting ATPase